MEKKFQMDGYTLHLIPSKKFKNITISLKLLSPLKKETATMRTMLSFMFSGGTKELPSTKLFSQYLENMYGARFGSTIGSKGLGHVIHLNSVTVNEAYILEDINLLEKQIKLLADVLYHPNCKDGLFDETIFKIKQKELKERIRVSKDDKFSYSLDRLFETMGENDVLGISSTGYLEEVDKIDNHSLYQYLQQSIQDDQKHIYIVGNIDESIVEIFKNNLKFPAAKNTLAPVHHFDSKRSEVLEVVEKQDITQAKLNMGYRVEGEYLSPKHYAFTVFNAVFGGFSQSRLFKVVREKHSLCYYVSSSYDAFNKILIVNAGIESDQYQKTRELIAMQLKEIQNGNFEEVEIEIAKKMLTNALKKSNDEPSSMIALAYNRDITNKVETNQEYIEKLQAVTKAEIIDAANTVILDTVYFLAGGQKNGKDSL